MDPDPRFDLLFILKIEKKKIPHDVNFVSGVKFNFKRKEKLVPDPLKSHRVHLYLSQLTQSN